MEAHPAGFAGGHGDGADAVPEADEYATSGFVPIPL